MIRIPTFQRNLCEHLSIRDNRCLDLRASEKFNFLRKNFCGLHERYRYISIEKGRDNMCGESLRIGLSRVWKKPTSGFISLLILLYKRILYNNIKYRAVKYIRWIGLCSLQDWLIGFWVLTIYIKKYY